MMDFNILNNEDYLEDDDDRAWQEFRAEAHRLCKGIDQRVVEAWLSEIGFSEPVGYYNNRCDAIMEIYTNRPGVLIGKAGAAVKRFEEILSSEFHRNYKIKFIEIRGGFANVN